MNITRLFQMTERWQLQVRGDFFNVLNHANWNDPGTTVSSSGTFGAVTSFGSPRIIQMAVKVFF